MSRSAPYRSFVYALLACALLGSAWASAAQAADFWMKGNVRGQIGDGLPVPITFAAAPRGPITGSTTVSQLGADPMTLVIPPAAMKRPAAPFNIGVAQANSIALQVFTSISVEHPKSTATFSAGGRTGPAIVTWCPGSGVVGTGTTPLNNPGCANPPATPTKGVIKYTATSNQFGGSAVAFIPSNTAMTGINAYANVAVRGGGAFVGPPCDAATIVVGTCNIAFANARPNQTGAGGWATTFSSGTVINPGSFSGAVTGNGLVTRLDNSLGAGPSNPNFGGGGPWTTGKVELTANSVFSPVTTEHFILSGSDARVSGVGTLSLVSGATSTRLVTGPNANRGWMNLAIQYPLPRPVPGLSSGAVLMLVGLVAGATLFLVRRAVLAGD